MVQNRAGALAVGFLQQDRDGKELMQQLTMSGTRVLATLPGRPSVYGNFAFDADHANIDQARLGVQSYLGQPRLMVNFESGYYKPQDNGDSVIRDINRREDPIFQLFSVSDELQFRGGLRYALARFVSTYADLSYQRYEQDTGSFVNGYVWSGGLLYLPGGDGLEVVRVEYYGIDSAGGNVNGGKLVYENRVYRNILFRANCNVGYYDKSTNQSGTSVGSLVGLGYVIRPGLVGELNFEGNRNQLYSEDFRFGFFLTYNFGYSTRPGAQSDPNSQGRPWPWAPAQFGPAAWGAVPAAWNSNSAMAGSGWAARANGAESGQKADGTQDAPADAPNGGAL